MESAKKHFQENIERVKNLGTIYQAINTQETEILDLSDILRAQYVMLVSALDHFIHEIVRLGMIEIYNQKRKDTKQFKEFIFSLDKQVLFKKAIIEEKNNQWLDYQIRRINGFKSFQEANKIEEAINLILKENIWYEVAKKLPQTETEIRMRLNLIIDRRNQIAHEADIQFEDKELRPIHSEDIHDSISFIEVLVDKIFNICHYSNQISH
jgi:hypothetical protein